MKVYLLGSTVFRRASRDTSPSNPAKNWRRHLRLTAMSIVLSLSFGLAAVSIAQTPSPVAAVAQEATAKVQQTDAPKDSLGRDTPRGTFEGYIKAVSKEDYKRAAEFLELAPLPADKRIRGHQLARILQQALDRNGDVPPTVMLSDKPEGKTDDDLSGDSESIGTLEIHGESVPLLLHRSENDKDGPIWLVASTTLQQLPRTVSDEASLPINQFIPETLVDNKWNGVPWGHWLAMLVLAGMAYVISRAVVTIVASVAQTVLSKKFPGCPPGLVRAVTVPIQWFVAVALFVSLGQRVGISIIVRQYFSEGVVIVAWVSVLWLIWRLVDVIATVSEQHMTNQARFGALSAVLFLRRSSRLLLVAVGIIVALHTAGFNVTTGLAALGIGGIAFALGAQKMMENLVGSMTLVFDQAVRIGDFCKVGETLGTIEQIGMRSTRIRTLDRTVVIIPNGDFSARKIENYTHRDRFLFRPILGVRYQTSPEQLRDLLTQLRGMLYSHPQVHPDPARVRFLGFASSSLDIEIFAYIMASDYEHFLEVQEDLNLRIADTIENSGTGFAFPSRTVYLANSQGQARQKAFSPETKARDWSRTGHQATRDSTGELHEATSSSADDAYNSARGG